MRDEQVVVVGYGMVGHRFTESLLRADPAARQRIVVLGEEPWPAYDRTRLSDCLSGQTTAGLRLAPQAVDVRLGCRVTRIDRPARTVVTAAGGRIRYDRLLLATGARPLIPPVPGRDADGCFPYRTLDDIRRIRAAARPGARGVVLGGGLLGLEAANALQALGMTPLIVERAAYPMSAQLDPAAGDLLARHLRRTGLDCRFGVTATGITAGRDGRVRAVTLSDGEVIEADLLLFAVGVTPRDKLAADCGLAVAAGGGVLVDAHARTGDPRIWAVGDCAAVAGRRLGLVGPGFAMADAVAAHLRGDPDDTDPRPLPPVRVKTLGIEVASFGDPHGANAVQIVRTDRRSVYRKLTIDGETGVLLGGILLGDIGLLAELHGHLGAGVSEPLLRLDCAAGRDEHLGRRVRQAGSSGRRNTAGERLQPQA